MLKVVKESFVMIFFYKLVYNSTVFSKQLNRFD